MRRTLFWAGWVILFALPVAFAIEIIVLQDLPYIAPWKWALLGGSVLLVFFSRDRDDVLKHHLA